MIIYVHIIGVFRGYKNDYGIAKNKVEKRLFFLEVKGKIKCIDNICPYTRGFRECFYRGITSIKRGGLNGKSCNRRQ